MDWLSRIATWLSDHEATISAVAAIIVIAGVIFAGVRWLLLRGTGSAPEKLRVRPGRRTVLIAASAAVIVIFAGVVTWLMLSDEPATEIAPQEDSVLALPSGPVVAVLPFENLSGDRAQDYFTDGLTEGIITALSRFRDLFVIARNSTFRYKGQAVDVRQLKQDLGAHYVLEGSVQRAGKTLRVTVQLLEAENGTHLWADSYDRDLSASGIFAVQDEITQQVVAMIAGRFGAISQARSAQVKEKPTESLDAYECVLRYRAYYRDAFSAPEHAKVRDCLERAVKSDLNYAEAWAGLAHIYLDEYRQDYNPRPGSLERAFEAARRAVALDPKSQNARAALAESHFFRHEFDRFFAEAERAIALNPNDVSTLAGMGERLYFAGDERGIALLRKAIKLDPFHPTWFNFAITVNHFDRGEYEEALAAAREIDVPGLPWPFLYRAAIYAELGRAREAESAVEELLRLHPDYTVARYIEEERKWNLAEDLIRRLAAALRKAGLPE